MFPQAKYEVETVDEGKIDKKELYELVRKCKLSNTVEEYNVNKGKLLQKTNGLLVRPGSTKNYFPFEKYFMDNWDQFSPMWVKAFRKRIPSQDSDHTQAVEGFFGKLKLYEKQQFGSRLPLIEELIPTLLKVLAETFHFRKLKSQNRRPQYYHKNPIFQEALYVASWHLTSLGMDLLWKNIKFYENRADHMHIMRLEDQPKEMMESQETKVDELPMKQDMDINVSADQSSNSRSPEQRLSRSEVGDKITLVEEDFECDDIAIVDKDKCKSRLV